MFERFTDRARKVMAHANQEAQRFNHEYIGTEHILLGLVKEGTGVGAMVLKNLDVGLRKVRLEVEKLLKSGPDLITMGKLPQTQQAKNVIGYAIEEARNLNHNYVGTEHLLLGLLGEHEGEAAQALLNLGLKLEDVRDEVLNVIGPGTKTSDSGSREAMLRRLYGEQIAAVATTRTEAFLFRCVSALPWATGLIVSAGLLLLIVYVITSIHVKGVGAFWGALLVLFALMAWAMIMITVLQIEWHLRRQRSDGSPNLKHELSSTPAKLHRQE